MSATRMAGPSSSWSTWTGETLDDRLTRGALPASDVVRYALQIADALAHAHRAHIVHRDLKPSNVMLTPSGAKLLDFGLARRPAVEPTAATSTVSFDQRKLTAEGTILGTFQYMAPEQLEGKEADARTDIFAFGTLLYEMATGRKAFEGQSQASLIASILTAQPPAISSTQPSDGLPPALDHVVERCLAKNPDDRWQTARDVKLELEWIAGGSSQASRVAAPTRRSRRAWLPWGAAGIAVAVAAGLAALVGVRESPPKDVTRFVVAPPAGTTIPVAETRTLIAAVTRRTPAGVCRDHRRSAANLGSSVRIGRRPTSERNGGRRLPILVARQPLHRLLFAIDGRAEKDRRLGRPGPNNLRRAPTHGAQRRGAVTEPFSSPS